MASNISQKTLPPFYASAHDDIEYTFSFNPYLIDSVTNDGGFLKINLQADFDVVPLIGEKIYILGSTYNGTHVIKTVTGTSSVTVNATYTSSISSNVYSCYHLRIPNFSLYKGRKTSEAYNIELPYTKVLDFKPILKYDNNLVPYLYVNLKGATKHLFNIVHNTVANSIDFSMFNNISVSWDNLETSFNILYRGTFVLNSTISNEELYNRIGYGIYLTPVNKPLISSRGITFASYIELRIDFFNTVVVPVIHKFINGVQV